MTALDEPLATPEQLATYMQKEFTGPELDRADLVLRVVSAWVRSTARKYYNSTNFLPPSDVIGVVLSAARREMVNPDRVITEQMGPLSVTRAQPPEGFFTPGEMQILLRKSGNSLFTVSTRREEQGWSTAYIHMREDLSDEPIPYLGPNDPGHRGTIHL